MAASLFATPCYAEDEPLVFSAAPTHSANALKQLYQPMADFISEVTGRKVIIDSPRNKLEYTNKMRNEEYDMLFDGAHFVGWRIEMTGHEPVVRLDGQIRVSVVIRNDSSVANVPVHSLDDLTGFKVCAAPPPAITTMAYLRTYKNPVRQPIIVAANSSKSVMQCLRSGKGLAAVLREDEWNSQDHEGLKLLVTLDRAYPERTLSVNDSLDEEQIAKLAEALSSEEGNKRVERVLSAFKAERLVPADGEDYDELGLLLENLWGFRME